MGKPDWSGVLATHQRIYEQQLGGGDPLVRSQARFGLAVQQALNDWYSDEMARGDNPGIALSAAAIAFGQVLGTMIVNASQDEARMVALVPAVLDVFGRELAERIKDIRSGQCEDMRVPQ